MKIRYLISKKERKTKKEKTNEKHDRKKEKTIKENFVNSSMIMMAKMNGLTGLFPNILCTLLQ